MARPIRTLIHSLDVQFLLICIVHIWKYTVYDMTTSKLTYVKYRAVIVVKITGGLTGLKS